MKWSNGPRQLHDLPSSSKINWSKYKEKKYLHFDRPVKIEHMKAKLQDPNWIASYAFLPSIHFKIVFKKYVTITKVEHGRKQKEKKKDRKIREIYYSAHKDSFIYKYYGDLLNNAYNVYAREKGISEIAVAYRNNKKGKNNVDFAYEVFNHMFTQQQSYIISLDFTKFFDNIKHKTLKHNIKRVLSVEELPNDWYTVYKNLIKYSYVHQKDIDEFLLDKYGKKKLKRIRKNLSQILESAEIREFMKSNLKTNLDDYGIPQGSGMSAVCSNVHLIDFDKEIFNWAKQKHPNALYRRYCDDLILVIPTTNPTIDELQSIKEEVLMFVEKYKSDGLIIQQKKTELRVFSNFQIFDEGFKKSTLDYLGFITDGKILRIRERSLFKYYSRAYKKAETSKRIAYATGRPGPKRKLYDLYTHLGYEYEGYGNFISYAIKAHKKMSQLPSNSLIRKQIKRHWGRVHNRLK